MENIKKTSVQRIRFSKLIYRTKKRFSKFLGAWNELLYIAIQGAIVYFFYNTEQISISDIFIIIGISSALFLHKVLLKDKI